MVVFIRVEEIDLIIENEVQCVCLLLFRLQCFRVILLFLRISILFMWLCCMKLLMLYFLLLIWQCGVMVIFVGSGWILVFLWIIWVGQILFMFWQVFGWYFGISLQRLVVWLICGFFIVVLVLVELFVEMNSVSRVGWKIDIQLCMDVFFMIGSSFGFVVFMDVDWCFRVIYRMFSCLGFVLDMFRV